MKQFLPDQCTEGTGSDFTTVEENGETIEVYGTAKVEITGTEKTKTGTVRLVKRK